MRDSTVAVLCGVVAAGLVTFLHPAPVAGQASATATAGAAATARAWVPPRTPWGHPDLQGTYSNDDETGTPMERPAGFEGRTLADITPEELQKIVAERNERFLAGALSENFAGGLSPPVHLIFDSFERPNKRAWLVIDPPDGRIPPQTDAARARPRRTGGVSTNANPRGPFNSWLDMGLYDRCITRGVPSSMMPAGYGSRYEIVQSPDSVAIRYEMVREVRVIPLDGRPHIDNGLQQYLGDARARWDGNTLVVETTNFRPETAPQRGSDKARLIERFTATAPDIVEWTVTLDDPATWTRPWTFSMPLTRVDRSQRIFEYACHEGNYAMRHILSAARMEDAGSR